MRHADTGNRMGVRTAALLTDMNQPLGRMCGNAVEVVESLEVLKGGGPDDVRLLTIELSAELLVSAGITDTMNAARQRCVELLNNGAAFDRWCRMVRAQGGDPDAVRNNQISRQYLWALANAAMFLHESQFAH